MLYTLGFCEERLQINIGNFSLYVENCHYSCSVWISPPLLWSYCYLPQVLFWFASILDTSLCHILYLLRSGCLCTVAQRPFRFRDISYFLLLFMCVYVCVHVHARMPLVWKLHFSLFTIHRLLPKSIRTT